MKKAFVGPKKRVVRKQILKDVSGMFAPGKITLLLGQPGSGKSSLLKMLSGRFPIEKNITFVDYVSQRDKHYPVLTVKETLEFAHKFCGGELSRRGEELLSKGSPQENLEALEAAKAVFEHYPEVIIEQLGLQNCQDTIVGDAMTRGVSGGERKRVTTGEMEFGMKYVTLMDEISTGLDSAATFDIISTQRSVAHKLRKTVVIALLQPSLEVFALFDDLMIMNEGQVMYHGPCNQVEEYFEGLGFSCPPERDIADYLLDLGTPEQYRYQVQNYHTKQPRSAGEFAEAFRESRIHRETLNELEAPHDEDLLHNVAEIIDPTPTFHQSVVENTMTLLRRQLMVTYRNTPFIVGRLMIIIIMGIVFSTVFYDFDPTQVAVVIGVLFATVMFLSMGQSSQIPTYLAERDIFYKQRGANFFRTGSYVLATSASQIPLAVVETIIFGSLVYWIILLLSNLSMGMWFFFLAAIGRNGNIATPLGMVSVLVFVVFAGFIVTKSQIPDYFTWAHWISPITWSLKALAVNQYRSDPMDVCVYEGVDYCATYGLKMGEYYLGLFGMDTEKEWVAYGIIYTAAIEDGGRRVVHKARDTTNKNAANGTDGYVVDIDNREKNFTPVTVAFQDLWYS
ncbi:hypothetical protein L916_12712, partial [Phytophthora nicotianae]